MFESFGAILDEVRRAWPYRWLGLALACAVATVVTCTIVLLPDNYTVTSQVAVSLNKDNEVPNHVKVAEALLLNDATLNAIIRKVDIGRNSKSTSWLDRAKNTLRSRIALSGQDSDTFSISYNDSDPKRAQQVSDLLLSAFMMAATDSSADNDEIASLQKQLDNQQALLSEAQQRASDYQRAHLDVFGQEGIDTRLDTARAAFDKAQSDYETVIRIRDQLQANWRSKSNRVASNDGDVSSAISLPISDSEIDQLNSDYADLRNLRTQYSESHPDVILARKQIELIVSKYPPNLRLCSDDDARASAATTNEDAVDVADPDASLDASSSSPVLNQATINVVVANIAVCRARAALTSAQSDFARLSAVASAAYPIQQQMKRLNAGVDAINAKIDDLNNSLSDLKGSIGSLSVSVVQAPTLPVTPTSPKRALMLLGTLGAALAVGAVSAYIGGVLANTFINKDEIQRTFGLPVYGTVSKISGIRSRIDQTADNLSFFFVIGTLIAILVGLMVADPLILAARQWISSGAHSFISVGGRFK